MMKKKDSLELTFRDHKDTLLVRTLGNLGVRTEPYFRIARVTELEDVPESEKRFHLTFEQLPSGIHPEMLKINDEA